MGLGALRRHGHAAVPTLTHAEGRDTRRVLEREVHDPSLVGVQRREGAGATIRANLLRQTLRFLGQRLIAPLPEPFAADAQRERVEPVTVDALQQVLEREQRFPPTVLADEEAAVRSSELEDERLLGLLELDLELEGARFGKGTDEPPEARPRIGLRLLP